MSGSIKSSLTRRILNACGSSTGRRRRVAAHAVIESLEDRALLSAASSVKYATTPAAGSVAPKSTSTTTTGTTTSSTATLAPLSETFNLSSRPSATKTIYLDFNGHTTVGTPWNAAFTNGQPIVSPAFSLDADTANFSNAELTMIQRIYQRVVEDFAPFDVNVTTRDPGVADLINSGGADSRWGIRVVIGGAYQDWLGLGAGGIAYLNSFSASTDIPTFVFSQTQLLNEQYIAETVSHEVGHTLGLEHDGTATLEYYGGHGTGPTSWGPIMGAPFDISVTQWSKGEYNGANNTEDDLFIITTQNGFGYRNDDYGNSRFTAGELTSRKAGGTRTVNTAGVIERNTDQDWFTFMTTGGLVNLQFDGDSISPNLDISVSLFNSTGTLLAVVNPAGSLSATLSLNLPAGTYSLMIDGVGFGTLANGYSDYGSIGQYFITGTIPDTSTSTGGTSAIEGRVLANSTNTGVSGAMVFIDLDGNGVFNSAVDRSARTDATGTYKFGGLFGGGYTVFLVTPTGWQPLTAGGQNVFVNVGATLTGNDFRVVRPPVLSSISGSIGYKRSSAPVLLAPSAGISDADQSNFAGGRLTVSLGSGAGAADVISVRNQGNAAGQVGAFAGFIRFGGVTVGTMSGGISGSALVITFNTNATTAIVQAVLRNLIFSTTSPAGTRTLSFSMTDGKGGVSSTLSKQVKVT